MRPGEEIRGEGGRFERIVVVHELARPPEAGLIYPASFVGHGYGPEGAELIVAERYRNLSPGSRDALLADVKRTASLRFPNLAQVQDASRVGADVFVTTTYVEGELLGSLRNLAQAAGRPISLDVGVRIVVDVLAALSALHTDKGPAGVTPPPPSLVHGAVAPHTIAVGFDGVTRLLRPYMGRLLSLNLDTATAPYAAPEQLRNGKGSPRADVFSVGVILWETLAQARLFEKATREARLARATTPISKLTLDGDRAWAAPLLPIVEKALAPDPLARYGTAAEMAAAVRLAVRAKLAMPARVAEIVDRNAGERILARRGELALPEPSSGDRRSVRPSVPDGAARVLANIRPSSRPPTPTPAAVAPVAVPKAPPVPTIAKPRAPNAGPRPAIAPVELTPAPPAADLGEDDLIAVESVRQPPVVAAAPIPPPVLPASLADEVLMPTTTAVMPVVTPPAAAAAPIATPAPMVAPPPPAPAAPPAPQTPSRPLVVPTRDAIAVPAEEIPAGLAPPGRRRWLPALLLLLLVPIAIIGYLALHRTPDGPEVVTSASATTTGTRLVPPPPSTPSTTAATATQTAPIPTATDTTSSATAEPSASVAPSATTWGTSTATPRPSNSTARPKPTYDPEGI